MKSILLTSILAAILSTGCTTKTPQIKEENLTALYQTATGKPESMVLACYKTTMLANGLDETRLRISVVDSLGLELLDAELPFTISVGGDAAVLNADRTQAEIISSSDTLKVWQSKLENGVTNLILKTGNTQGKFKVEASADGVWPASHEIHLIPADVNLMKPSPDQLKPSGHLRPKMIGADISFLPQLEAEGMKFYDNGIEQDAIDMLKNHGFNYVRLRIFVNPEHEKGYSPGKGYCGLESTLAMAKRVGEAGMNLLLDFHYSDYWADPQQQFKPSAWEGQDFETLSGTLGEYTRSTLQSLKEQGTLPQMVQIGNEINHGIVWPEGHIGNPDKLAALLKAGVEACRSVDSSIAVMMHIALGGQNEEAIFWFDNMIARGVEFDIIGLSYYPRWHGSLDNLQFNLKDMAARYNKDVNVVEYSAFKREIHDIVFNLPDGRGQGTCIWEPLNTWSRIFDEMGNALEVINLYDEISKVYVIK
ncbi:MAG: glycosyl hydrolase 53 family protein [Lentimicrobium sp.]|nr:glycosyl hydrolase 53 family protein [Lentimicrobium sp.]